VQLQIHLQLGPTSETDFPLGGEGCKTFLIWSGFSFDSSLKGKSHTTTFTIKHYPQTCSPQYTVQSRGIVAKLVKRQKNTMHIHLTDTGQKQFKLGGSGLLQQQQRARDTHKRGTTRLETWRHSKASHQTNTYYLATPTCSEKAKPHPHVLNMFWESKIKHRLHFFAKKCL